MNIDQSVRQKLKRFEESIDRRAQETCADIEAELAAFSTTQLQTYEESLKEAGEKDLHDQLAAQKAQNARALSRQKNEYKKQLYAKREACREKIFERVRNNLLAFAASADYEAFLLEQAAELAATCSEPGSVILLRTQDTPHTQAVSRAFGSPCEIRTTDAITLGGLMLKNTSLHLLIDLSLDNALSEQKQAFFNNRRFGIEF